MNQNDQSLEEHHSRFLVPESGREFGFDHSDSPGEYATNPVGSSAPGMYKHVGESSNPSTFEDSRITFFLFNQHKMIEILRLQLLIVSSVILVLDYYDNFSEREDQSDYYLWTLFGLTAVFDLLTYLTYVAKHNYAMAATMAPEGQAFRHSEQFGHFISEFLLVSLIPTVFTDDIQIPFHQYKDPKRYFYTLNELLVLCLLLRGFLLIKLFIRSSEYYCSSVQRICNYYQIALDLPFLIRLWTRDSPIRFALVLYFIGQTVFTVCIWVAEYALHRDSGLNPLFLLSDSFYTVYFSSVLSSYSGFYPESLLGRLVCWVIVLYGFTLICFMQAALVQYFWLTDAEYMSSTMLDVLIKRRKIDKLIAGLASEYYYLIKYDVNPFTHQRVHLIKLYLKTYRQQIRDCTSTDPYTFQTGFKNSVSTLRKFIDDFYQELLAMRDQQRHMLNMLEIKERRYRFVYDYY